MAPSVTLIATQFLTMKNSKSHHDLEAEEDYFSYINNV